MAASISTDSLAALLREVLQTDDLVCIDARPSAAFYRGHIKHAVNVCLPASLLSIGTEDERGAPPDFDLLELDGLDTAARLALERVPLCSTVVAYDSGGRPLAGSAAGDFGPAASLAALLVNSLGGGGPDVMVLDGGYGAFSAAHRSLVSIPPPSAGHASAAGVIDLTPKGAASAAAAAAVLHLDGGRFRVWVGGARDAADREALRRMRVGYVLNCAKECICHFRAGAAATAASQAGLADSGLRYHKISVVDEPDADLRQHFDEGIRFLRSARAAAAGAAAAAADDARDDTDAFVHCHMGRSRSVTVAAAFAVAELGVGAEEALDIVAKAKPDAAPNYGFREQLTRWASER